MTTPTPWSMKSPSPTRAAGWISIPVAARLSAASVRGTSGTPRPVEGVGDAVGQERVDAGPQREHVERPHAARRRVALVDGVDVAAELADDAATVRGRASRVR